MRKHLLTTVLACAAILHSTGYSKTKTIMKMQKNETAPAFKVKDINGQEVSLEKYRGKKILLSFHRFAGCPVCNIRFHQLEQEAPYFRTKGLVMLAVYESSESMLKKYTGDNNYNTIMIADPEEALYKLYTVERSSGKLMKGMFKGAIGMVLEGNKLFKEKLKKDGHIDRIGADFLIDEQGKIITAHYGRYLGDNLSTDSIKALIN
jgi:thioredoxin-dependent peroxiredoxin